MVGRLWLRTSPVHSIVFFLHNKDILCYFGPFLVDSGHYQLTSTTSTTFLLVELVIRDVGAGGGGGQLPLPPNFGVGGGAWPQLFARGNQRH